MNISNTLLVLGILLFTVSEFSGTLAVSRGTKANCVCGKAGKGTTNSKIIGGEVAPNHKWRWQAIIYGRDKINCGGSLITDKHILTAAHCVKPYAMGDIRIDLNDYDRSKTTESKVISRKVTKVTYHPNYDAKDYKFDAAILTMDKVVDLEATEEPMVTPVCIPTPTGNNTNRFDDMDDVIATGYGKVTENGQAAQILGQIKLPVLKNSQCVQMYKDKREIADNMMCAGMEGKGASQYDGGGPLNFRGTKGQYTQIGIMTYVIGNGKKDMPTVAMRTIDLKEWIYETADDAKWCKTS